MLSYELHQPFLREALDPIYESLVKIEVTGNFPSRLHSILDGCFAVTEPTDLLHNCLCKISRQLRVVVKGFLHLSDDAAELVISEPSADRWSSIPKKWETSFPATIVQPFLDVEIREAHGLCISRLVRIEGDILTTNQSAELSHAV